MSITVIQGDITRCEVDVIVNAANSGLRGGGGVDGAIHKAGGPAIMAACREIGGCPTGEARITTAGDLPAQKVIHAVGPIWQGGHQNEPQLLASAYLSSLQLAVSHLFTSIAFPNISTGVYGFPKTEAAAIAVGSVREFIDNHEGLLEVVFVCFDEGNYRLYQQLLHS